MRIGVGGIYRRKRINFWNVEDIMRTAKILGIFFVALIFCAGNLKAEDIVCCFEGFIRFRASTLHDEVEVSSNCFAENPPETDVEPPVLHEDIIDLRLSHRVEQVAESLDIGHTNVDRLRGP